MSVSLLLVTQEHKTLKRSNTLSDMNECYPSTIATEDQVRLAEEECLGQAATGQRDEYMKQKNYEPGSETGSSKKPITCILVFNYSNSHRSATCCSQRDGEISTTLDQKRLSSISVLRI